VLSSFHENVYNVELET